MQVNRPSQIKRLIQDGKSPILAFEKIMLEAEFNRLGLAQGELSRLLGEAMDQSSETWHDNAPADAVSSQSGVIAERAERVIKELQHVVQVEYPSLEEKLVTLGSVIGIRYPGEHETERVILTGVSRILPKLMPSIAYEGVDVVTVRSPLGAAILGHAVESTAVYMANGHLHTVDIVNVAQLDPQSLAEATGETAVFTN